jgi:hypothetical protein
VAPLDATGVEMSLVETGAATTEVSDVVRTSAAIVANETVRNAEENNPWLIDIRGSLSCQPNLPSCGPLQLIEVNHV